ncbi:hypothetical protein Tco_0897857 [Tanacetum coccineum]
MRVSPTSSPVTWAKATSLKEGRIPKNLLDRVSQLRYPFSLPERLKADNTVRVNRTSTLSSGISLVRLDNLYLEVVLASSQTSNPFLSRFKADVQAASSSLDV